MLEKYPHVNKAHKYCRDIVSGKIDSCDLVRASCQRQLDDLAKEKTSLWKFDKDKAERVCRFVEMMKHVKGKWANEQIVLQPWQCFIFCSVFGWVDKQKGLRRFREAYIEVPRKNGKSVIAAGMANYMFLADGEAGAEVYCGATTEKQAWEVFRPAKLMLEKSPKFKEVFDLELFAKSMYSHRTASRFEPVIGKPGDGASPHFAVADEYHEHPTSELVDTMITGMGARSQPLMLEITTAGTNPAGPCKTQHDYVVQILNKQLEDERVFGIIYTIDASDDWVDFNCWKKANPNYGVSVNEDYLKIQYDNARQKPSQQNINRCKHLNQWLNVDNSWLDIVKLNSCVDKDITIESLKGKRCVIGVDLASKIDMAAAVICFFDGNNYYAFCKFYLPRETVEKPENQHYQTWELSDYLTVTEGAVIDFETIKEDVLSWYMEYSAEGICYDPWQATQFSQELESAGAVTVETRQVVGNMSEPMKELEAAIYSKRFKYNGNPILYWMFGNVICHRDNKDNVYPKKAREENKIDGVVALIMCLNLAIRLKNSKQEEPGMIFI